VEGEKIERCEHSEVSLEHQKRIDVLTDVAMRERIPRLENICRSENSDGKVIQLKKKLEEFNNLLDESAKFFFLRIQPMRLWAFSSCCFQRTGVCYFYFVSLALISISITFSFFPPQMITRSNCSVTLVAPPQPCGIKKFVSALVK
jgi:hypothetical protein